VVLNLWQTWNVEVYLAFELPACVRWTKRTFVRLIVFDHVPSIEIHINLSICTILILSRRRVGLVVRSLVLDSQSHGDGPEFSFGWNSSTGADVYDSLLGGLDLLSDLIIRLPGSVLCSSQSSTLRVGSHSSNFFEM